MRSLLAALLLASTLGGCAGSLRLTPVQSSDDKPANVAVYFRVEDRKGEPLAGLTADQFRIYEDERLVSAFESKQTILNPEVAASHYTLLLVDMSGSVAESGDATQVVDAVRQFTETVEANNKVAIYAFDGEPELHKIADFTGSAKGVDNRAARLSGFKPSDPSTNLHGAVVAGLARLDEALDKAKNPLRFGTLVVFTDGSDRAARVSAAEMGQALDDTPYNVFAIGLGAEIREDELEAIGRDGTAMAGDPAAVATAFEDIATTIEGRTKSYYLLSYCSPARAGAHEVTVEAVVPNPEKKGERKGQLTTEFNAEGFTKGCDPNRKPKFDITKGESDAPASRGARKSARFSN